MITGKDIYEVMAAIVPLYVAMILAYGSVRWWKIFTAEQCSGINRFVAVFAVPLLSFHFISLNDPYAMNYHFIAADSLQKVIILAALFAWNAIGGGNTLDWTITLFSLSTLPNTLVMGIPLLRAMYGDFSGNLMVQIVVLQSVVWYTLMLFMFEYRAAKLLISDQFPETAGSITSFRVDSDVVSLNGREPLQADAEIGDDGKLHVVVRRSNASSIVSSFNKSQGISMTPRASNLTGVEIYSVQSSREPTPRASSFNQSDFYAMFASKAPSPKNHSGSGGGGGDVFSVQSSKGVTPRTSNFDPEEMMKTTSGKRRGSGGGRSMSAELGPPASYPAPNPMFAGSSSSTTNSQTKKKESAGANNNNKELHMFVWSSSASPVSEGNPKLSVTKSGSADLGALDPSKATYVPHHDQKGMHELNESAAGGGKSPSSSSLDHMNSLKSNSKTYEGKGGDDVAELGGVVGLGSGDFDDESGMNNNNNINKKQQQMPPASVMTRLILIMVWRKLIRNPNTYSSLIGLAWSLVSFKWHIKMPTIVSGSISILSDAGLGMAMFSLGLFMALQPKIIACGKSVATFSMAVRFLTGPAVIAATSIVIGLRGVLLHVAIVQAALPQGIVPFVFAKEYNVHPDILSTAVIFGMLIALPITILYYVLLGL